MRRILEKLESCARELTDFQRRANDLQSQTDSLISGSKETIAESRQMMTGGDGHTATPQLGESSPDEFSPPPTPSEGIEQKTIQG